MGKRAETETDVNDENSEIWDEISYNRGKIDMYAEKIEEYCANVNELEEVKRELSRIENGFYERQRIRKEALRNIQLRTGNIKMVSIYAEGMDNFLNGNKYIDVCTSIRNAHDRLDEKISYFNDETQFFKDEISRCEEMISYWYGRLKK